MKKPPPKALLLVLGLLVSPAAFAQLEPLPTSYGAEAMYDCVNQTNGFGYYLSEFTECTGIHATICAEENRGTGQVLYGNLHGFCEIQEAVLWDEIASKIELSIISNVRFIESQNRLPETQEQRDFTALARETRERLNTYTLIRDASQGIHCSYLMAPVPYQYKISREAHYGCRLFHASNRAYSGYLVLKNLLLYTNNYERLPTWTLLSTLN